VATPSDATDRYDRDWRGSTSDTTGRDTPRGRDRVFWGIVPLALVILTLLGSVAIPAYQTWRITRLLRQSNEVLAPARLLVEQLQAGLAKELTALQGFALVGDGALLDRYRATAVEDEGRMAVLEALANRLDPAVAGRVPAIRRQVAEWRGRNDALLARRGPGPHVAVALRDGQARHDAAMGAIADLSATLAAVAAGRDDRVRVLERFSIVANAALVLVALVAVMGVLVLTLRERRLTGMLQRRVLEAGQRARREAALRETAEALAGAYTRDEVTECIVHAALAAVEGGGAFIEQVVAHAGESPDAVAVRAVAGRGVPPIGTTGPFAGSYAELATTRDGPVLIPELRQAEPAGIFTAVADPAGSAIVVPLGDGGRSMGALFVVGAEGSRFGSDDVARAEIFGHLAALAYEKVRLLEEAHERRRVLERVVQSRSRLVRGFSHDLKNPIGAADGFAELLTLGVYGALTAEQSDSVERMRRCIQGALTLIGELQELARAETGTLALSAQPVDLGALVRAIGEEYQAAARASGLSLTVEVQLDEPVVETDGARVRQIASNLLSNAIKYTGRGSVRVRTRRESAGPGGEAGDWVLLEVIDSGPGIPAEQQEFIFEEFSRLGDGSTPGAGLGLAISRTLAQALGGRISVRSEPAHGSTFTLWLPYRATGWADAVRTIHVE
jgi:signal transduction histidine kinase